MAKSDPTKDPEFKRVLGNLLKAPPKTHADMKSPKQGMDHGRKRPTEPAKRGPSV
jgi:hypothetical protein